MSQLIMRFSRTSQLTFVEAECEVKKRKTRREKFLERMDGLIP